MQELTLFHRCASELLQCLGFNSPAISIEEEIISLLIEQRFHLHLGYLDCESWFMLVDLGKSNHSDNVSLLEYALRQNQLNSKQWQPHIALNEAGHLTCWLKLYYRETNFSLLTESVETLINYAESLLNFPIHSNPL